MLLSFRVANHASFREPQELNLVPVYKDGRPALTVAAIYGANASGKSTLLDAFRFFRWVVRESQAQWLPDDPIERRPFLLDHESRTEPSSYAVDVLIGEVRYVYGFSVSDRAVEEEWLYSYPKGRRRVLFERRGMKVEFGASLTGERAAAGRMLRPNSLYLSAAAQTAHKQLTVIWKRIRDSAVIDDYTRQHLTRSGSYAASIFEKFEKRGIARDVDVLKAADLGVHGLRRGDDVDPGASRAMSRESWEKQSATTKEELSRSLRFVHRVGDEEFLLPVEDESAGTKTWLNLVACALRALEKGWLLWIDEIDVSLHPLLTAKLIRLFQSPELNPLGGQLVFTTHDSALLGTMLGEEVLRRDQIWFVEKSADTGASELYPLSDFRPSKGENHERRYLAGRYGAVPVLPDTALEDMVRKFWGVHGEADVST